MNLRDVEKEILNINTKKVVMSNSIPAKVLKGTLNICNLEHYQIWNDEILKIVNFLKI